MCDLASRVAEALTVPEARRGLRQVIVGLGLELLGAAVTTLVLAVNRNPNALSAIEARLSGSSNVFEARVAAGSSFLEPRYLEVIVV